MGQQQEFTSVYQSIGSRVCCCSSWMICFENTTTAHKSSLLLSRRARKRAKAKAREREKRGKITSHLCSICKKVIAILTVGRCIVFHFLSFLPPLFPGHQNFHRDLFRITFVQSTYLHTTSLTTYN